MNAALRHAVPTVGLCSIPAVTTAGIWIFRKMSGRKVRKS